MTDIRSIRKQLGLNQAELGEQLDLTQSTVSRMETGDLAVDKRTELALQALVHQHDVTPTPDAEPTARKVA